MCFYYCISQGDKQEISYIDHWGNHERACYFSCHPILPDYSQNPQASLFFCFPVLLLAFSSQFINGRDFRVTEGTPAATTTAEPSEGR